MSNELAIVIPAYKIDFFDDVLASLNAQTCKRFNVYVGIDASRFDFESVINRYSKSINIMCKRFDSNLGGKDLVAQWNRCMQLTQGEKWVMLFSDDDRLESCCVERFYEEMEADEKCHRKCDLYHFDVDVIDGHNNIIRQTRQYPSTYESVDFLKDKCKARIESFVVEYVFRRSEFDACGGFEHFDMAWGSDIATWAKIGRNNGIRTISGAKVMWRASDMNIPPDTSRGKIARKLAADAKFLKWCRDNFKEVTLGDTYYYMFRLLFHYSPYIKKNDLTAMVKPFYSPSISGRALFFAIKACYPAFGFANRLMHHSL